VSASRTEPADIPSRGAATPEDAVRQVLEAWRDGKPERAEPYLGDDPDVGRSRILPLPAGHRVLLVTGSCQPRRDDEIYCRIAQPDDAATGGDAHVVGTRSSGYLVTQIYLVDFD
jgi:hypothetical protein